VLSYLHLAFLKKHDTLFDEKHVWDQPRPIIPYPTGRFFRGTLFLGASCQATIGVVPTGRGPFGFGPKSPDVTFALALTAPDQSWSSMRRKSPARPPMFRQRPRQAPAGTAKAGHAGRPSSNSSAWLSSSAQFA
jgi:hypothetical protein